MGIVVQTNIPSLIAQNSLTKASNAMNTAMERMTTGYKLNSAKDDAAGLYVATSLDKNIRGSEVAKQNVQMGNDMISTAEGDLTVIQDNLLRIRDLAVTAANGVYNQESLEALQNEVIARTEEINRLAATSEYNGLKLLSNEDPAAVDTRAEYELRLQVGANSSANDAIIVKDVFQPATASALQMITGTDVKGAITTAMADADAAATFINSVDKALENVQTRRSTIGTYQNRLDSVATSLTTTIENLTSSKSTIMDADIAKESSNYINAQILQQAATSLLAQANQAPQVALSLI